MAERTRVALKVVLRQRALLSLVLTVAVGLQAAHGAPSRATKVLRALECCATMCRHHHPVSETGARRCCNLSPTDADSGIAAPLTHADMRAAATGLVVELPVPPSPVLASGPELPLASARAAPVFLLSRALRL